MRRVGSILLGVFFMIACNNESKEEPEDDTVFQYESFSGRFKQVTLPYVLSDTGLLKNEDTATIRSQAFLALIPDSIPKKLFGNSSKVKYVPLSRVEARNGEQYFILKALSGAKKAALLVTFDKEHNYGAALPFLVPDNDAKTTQTSSIDKALSITRSVASKTEDDVVIEGKDVYAYNKDAKQYTLIMTDLLNEGNQEVINPIDTLSRQHRFAGDYTKGKRNMVSVRDGRTDKEINFFIHFEKEDGACTGELKGSAFFTTTTTAVYRQGGNPCVLELEFKKSAVAIREVGGCGSFRDLQCVFEGSFTKKKESKPKTDKKEENN